MIWTLLFAITLNCERPMPNGDVEKIEFNSKNHLFHNGHEIKISDRKIQFVQLHHKPFSIRVINVYGYTQFRVQPHNMVQIYEKKFVFKGLTCNLDINQLADDASNALFICSHRGIGPKGNFGNNLVKYYAFHSSQKENPIILEFGNQISTQIEFNDEQQWQAVINGNEETQTTIQLTNDQDKFSFFHQNDIPNEETEQRSIVSCYVLIIDNAYPINRLTIERPFYSDLKHIRAEIGNIHYEGELDEYGDVLELGDNGQYIYAFMGPAMTISEKYLLENDIYIVTEIGKYYRIPEDMWTNIKFKIGDWTMNGMDKNLEEVPFIENYNYVEPIETDLFTTNLKEYAQLLRNLNQ
eukprot:NODE_1232_length_1691_cov_0.243090.p1 type:complete len:353 gc:universal NODE_1232_length_1691_cov_0.243090:226-1284(+)